RPFLQVDYCISIYLYMNHDRHATDFRDEDARRSHAPCRVRTYRGRGRDRGDVAGEGVKGFAAGRVAASARAARGRPRHGTPGGAGHLRPPVAEGAGTAEGLAQLSPGVLAGAAG